MKQNPLNIEASKNLTELVEILSQLKDVEYTQKINLFGNATIGEHTRHIIELFQQLIIGYDSGLVNYDDRKRDLRLQNDRNFSATILQSIIKGLDKENKNLKIVSLYNNEEEIESNYLRELMFNIEHCIHHQAIIKIGLLYLGKSDINENFGVAKSTIEYKKTKCAQ